MNKKTIALIAIGIFVVWAGSGWAINTWINASYRGTFGDMFGAVNALFSGFAFAGLIYTIAVQRQELAEQKNSINMQTNELKLQVEASKMQTEELALQREAIQMQTEELGLQRKAIQMQTEEIKMQREETARSADQLEGQKNLLNLQMATSIVDDLIILKNKRCDEIPNIQIGLHYSRYSISELLENYPYEETLISEDARHLQSYLNTFFFILEFIQKYDLENNQKDMLSNLVNMNTTDNELKLIYIAVQLNQHRLMMLRVHGFYPRHQKLTEETTMPSI
ncbi:hypothetical protein AB1I68_00665 [Paenibacillus pabuli]|uniref:hypothetical protein n=1 Tax=Paenibacillus pabuli TaxID=1472 RepID=UPI00345AE2B0